MEFTWYVAGYFVIGVALFMAFWRWFESGDADTEISILLLILWPAVLISFFVVETLELLKKIAKTGVKK